MIPQMKSSSSFAKTVSIVAMTTSVMVTFLVIALGCWILKPHISYRRCSSSNTHKPIAILKVAAGYPMAMPKYLQMQTTQ